VGDEIALTLQLANNGPDTAAEITVELPLPAGLSYQSDTASDGSYEPATGIWSLDSLSAYSSVSLIVSGIVEPGAVGDSLNCVATIGAVPQADPDSSNNSDAAIMVVQSADLSLSSAASDSIVDEGETVTYTLVLANAGPDAAQGLQVSVPLPEELNYLDDNPGQGSYNSGSGVWNVGDLASGVGAMLQINTWVGAGTAGDSIVTTAWISPAQQADPDTTNNSALTHIRVRSADLALSRSWTAPGPHWATRSPTPSRSRTRGRIPPLP
jgi:uncharacterized repeat protein (TIGR01451 family)